LFKYDDNGDGKLNATELQDLLAAWEKLKEQREAEEEAAVVDEAKEEEKEVELTEKDKVAPLPNRYIHEVDGV